MYKLTGTTHIKRLNDNTTIPIVDGNVDYEDYKQWIAEGNTPEPEFTEEEIAQQELNKQIQEAKQYLTDTDWIVVKLQEAQLLGSDISEMLTKYSTELTKREECRALINELGGN